MDHFFSLSMSLQQIGTDLGVAPFQFVIRGFPDIVQQTASACEGSIEPDQFGHHAGQEGNFHAVAKHILAVAGSEVETSKHLEDFFVETTDIGFLGCFHSLLADVLIYFLLGLRDDFFDASWMDASVGDEFLE
jgi:hypothetical protein